MHVFDIESDGLLDDITVVHCINVIHRETGKHYAFNGGAYKDGSPAPRDGTIEDGLAMLAEAEEIAGQRIIDYDIPAIQIVYPGWKPKGRVFDSLICSRVIYPDLDDRDFKAIRGHRLPVEFQEKGLVGKHSLEAWGYRLSEYKGDFKPEKFNHDGTDIPHTWKTIGFTQEMDAYARQDPVVTLKLIELIESKNYSPECLELEHRVAHIVSRQKRYGFAFNEDGGWKLLAKLQGRKAELDHELRQTFKPWYTWDGKDQGRFIPKRDNKSAGYTGGAPMSKVKQLQFNPGSRHHIADRLIKLHGWEPVEFTPTGEPKIDETTLDGLTFPEGQLLKEFLMIDKRIGMMHGDDDKGWLNKVRNGRIHGDVNTNGAVTGRMTHSNPNVAQTPRVGSPYGSECRELFIAPAGRVLVGCDAEGIELRELGHYMARIDGGEFANAVVNGKKEDGTDAHSINKKNVGMRTRDGAKTLIYAFLYGAGPEKLGTIFLDDMTEEYRRKFFEENPAGPRRAEAVKKLGKVVKKKFLAGLPALKELIDDAKAASVSRGYVIGHDGRQIMIRSAHAALNTLLQGGGAVVMKKALVILDEDLQSIGLVPGRDYEFVANVHDEWQIETEERYAEEIGKRAASAIAAAGRHFNLRCPLAGSYASGKNWKETH